MNYDYQVSFVLQGGATQIMYFTKDNLLYVDSIANDLQSIRYDKVRL